MSTRVRRSVGLEDVEVLLADVAAGLDAAEVAGTEPE
jgi:cystathionine beta-lyase/cystathionine gamma-synthase